MQRLTFSTLIPMLLLLISREVKCDYSPKVIIVGAGPAGIAAAAKLFENNISNVLILEAERRIGGRIYSRKFANGLVDLGAEYCQGEKNNVVFQLANKYDLLEHVEMDYNFCYSSREHINSSFPIELYNMFEDIYGKSSKRASSGISLGEYVIEKYTENVMEKYGKSKKQLKYAKEILEIFMTFINAYEGSFSSFDVSAKRYYEECEGTQTIIWRKGGYKTILDILIKKYPYPEDQLPVEKKILINKEVTKIIWNNNNNDSHDVVIKCLDKSFYKADHVIFTPSLGVLKATSQDLFDPPLPKEKVNAINKLGFGAVSKILLHFPEAWWSDTNFTNFIPVWAKADKSVLLKEFPYGPIKNGKSWLLNVGCFLTLNENNPNVLVVWSGGEFVPEIEQLPDDILINGFTYILHKFLGDKYPNITKPDALLHNKWYANPHFRGTYSFETVESHTEGVSQEEILLQPLVHDRKPIVMFAGEATHPTHYATVHGAIETGQREAQRIIDLYQ